MDENEGDAERAEREEARAHAGTDRVRDEQRREDGAAVQEEKGHHRLILTFTVAYNAWFQCINGCPGQFDLREVIYRCPTCGDLLEVQHDMDALRSRSAAAWMQLFKDRTHGNVYPYGSGVWSKKEWVVPFIDNENIVSMYEGNSNLLWADRYGKQLHVEDLWIKQCSNSHTGSFKDLGMTVLVSIVKQMMAGGVPIDAVACASTGDTSAALGASMSAPRASINPRACSQPTGYEQRRGPLPHGDRCHCSSQ